MLGLGLRLGLQRPPAQQRAVLPPVNTVLPVITGDAISGETLSCSTGTWTGSPTSYAHQWKADGDPIEGATASTYELTDDEIGAVIICTVTATNAGGSTPATSVGTEEVEAADAIGTYLGRVATSGGTIDIGAAADDSLIVGVLQYHSSGVRTLNTFAIGGSAATPVAGSSNSKGSYIRQRLVTGGGSIAITWSFDAPPSSHSCAVYKLNGLASITPVDTDEVTSDNPAGHVDTLAGGVSVAGVACRGTTTEYAWTGADEDADVAAGSGRFSTAHRAPTTTEPGHAVSVSGGTTSDTLTVAAWR